MNMIHIFCSAVNLSQLFFLILATQLRHTILIGWTLCRFTQSVLEKVKNFVCVLALQALSYQIRHTHIPASELSRTCGTKAETLEHRFSFFTAPRKTKIGN
jgi:hypothetical protein